MLVSHVHIQIRFSVKGFATEATSPKVDPIVKLGQFLQKRNMVLKTTYMLPFKMKTRKNYLNAEHIAGKM